MIIHSVTVQLLIARYSVVPVAFVIKDIGPQINKPAAYLIMSSRTASYFTSEMAFKMGNKFHW